MSRDAKIFVGNLPRDVREQELDDLFYKYGRITDISVKNGYAFVAFEDDRDASDAIRGRDGIDFAGGRLRVEFAGRRGGRDYRDRGDRRDRDRGRGYTGKHSDYRMLVSGLPSTCSWQDLKDFCRDAGDVLFTDVSRDGNGVVEFAKQDDLDWALKNLDGKRLKTHLGDSDYVTCKEDGAKGDSRSDNYDDRDRDDRDDRRDRDDDYRREDDDYDRRRHDDAEPSA